MRKWIVSFYGVLVLTVSCHKETDFDQSSFIGTKYMGTYNTVTNHPFGDPPPTYNSIDSFVTNVHFNDGYVVFFYDSVLLSQLTWGEHL